MSTENETITTRDYDKTHPVYMRIRKEFAKKLKAKYNCDDFDKIVDYIMDFVFEKKATKAECISNMNSLFNGKADVMIDYLWKITKDIENSSDDYANERSNRNWKKNKYKNNRERSRSYSSDRSGNKFNQGRFKQNLMPRGFYPPKMKYGAPMMPMGVSYPPPQYLMPNPAMMQRFKPNFHPKKPAVPSEKKEEKEGENAQENPEKTTEEENKKLMEQKEFEKLSPEEQKAVLDKRVPTKKVRCKNWPNCNDPTCIYSHPTQTCPHFPKCMYGDKCCYIHPSIPCKFGYYCTRIGCSYSHPQGSNPGMAMFPNMMRPVPFMKHKSKNPGPNAEKNQENAKAEQKPEEKNNENENQGEQNVVQNPEQKDEKNANEGN